MTEPQKYFNAAAFRMALETRLKNKTDTQDVDVFMSISLKVYIC